MWSSVYSERPWRYEMELVNHVLSNPLNDIIRLGCVENITSLNGLERIYNLEWNNKVLNVLRNAKPYNKDIFKIDHNTILNLYPDNEYMFGPFADSNKEEVNLIYLLYTNNQNNKNRITVLYANRILEEFINKHILNYENSFRNYRVYLEKTKSLDIIHNKYSYNTYYHIYNLTEKDRSEAVKLYNGKSISNSFTYNSRREVFNVCITIGTNVRLTVNAFRLLCELHIVKRRLEEDELAFPINGKKADLRIENVGYRNKNANRIEAKKKYGLDVDKLEFILGNIQCNRFKGVYTHNDKASSRSLGNRRYVKMIDDKTEKEYAMLLSRALLTVKYGRILGPEEEVDHIDNNRTNDSIENLRLVSRRENRTDDGVKLEIRPVNCCICNKEVKLNTDNIQYYNKNPNPVTCSPKCLGIFTSLPEIQKEQLRSKKHLNYSYYVLDKFTRERKYFKSKNYKECRTILAKDKANAFIN